MTRRRESCLAAQVLSKEFSVERYSEENSFPPIYFMLMGVAFLFSFLGLICASAKELSPNIFYLSVGAFVLVFFLMVNLSQIRTVVTSERVHIRLGRVFPFWRSNLLLADIQTVSIVEIGWWRRWNLGVHLIHFRTHATWAMFYGGRRAVWIERNRRMRVLVGSEDPEALVAAITRERERITR